MAAYASRYEVTGMETKNFELRVRVNGDWKYLKRFVKISRFRKSDTKDSKNQRFFKIIEIEWLWFVIQFFMFGIRYHQLYIKKKN